MPVYERRSPMPVSADDVFAWHVRVGALERLAPPWRQVRVLERGDVVDGGRLVFDYKVGPVWRRWVAQYAGAVPGRQFIDRQLAGPFAAWEHTHRFLPGGPHGCEQVDHVEFRLPARVVADPLAGGRAVKSLERLFRFRHIRTGRDLGRHLRWRDEPRLRVAVAGGGGLIGANLSHYLTSAGHDVVRLVRRPVSRPGEVSWDPAAGRLDPADLIGVDAVVNLAGVSLFGLWTSSRRQRIMDSRVQSTATLTEAIRAMPTPPAVFVSVSAVGFYGSRGGEAITEETAPGEGFLAEVCRAWEAAAAPARAAGVRVVTPRLGIVMSAAGGALATMLPAFRVGVGARLGDGHQWWSWVDLDDALAALEWVLHDKELDGALNVAAPEPVTNRELTRTLGHVLRRPAALAAPGAAVSRGLGGVGREMLLASQRAVPARLNMRGFRFAYPALEQALRFELGRW